MLNPGDWLKGEYLIEGVVGTGGAGTVYRAVDRVSGNRPVAIKALRFRTNDEAMQAQARSYFEREAHVLAGLKHPNIVEVLAYFEIDGRPYMVTEFIEGVTLQQWLRAAPAPATVPEAVAWMLQVADSLVYLHAQSPPVIHGDIKPANLILDDDERVHLIDFGIARTHGLDRATTHLIKGMMTPGYAPLEQYGREKLDGRADVYALGATMYALLTRQVPPSAVALAAGNAGLAPASSLNPDVPPRLNHLLTRMMALKRVDRMGDMREVRQELQSFTSAAPTRRLTSLPQAPRSNISIMSGPTVRHFRTGRPVGRTVYGTVFMAEDPLRPNVRYAMQEMVLNLLQPDYRDSLAQAFTAAARQHLEVPDLIRFEDFFEDSDLHYAVFSVSTPSARLGQELDWVESLSHKAVSAHDMARHEAEKPPLPAVTPPTLELPRQTGREFGEDLVHRLQAVGWRLLTSEPQEWQLEKSRRRLVLVVFSGTAKELEAIAQRYSTARWVLLVNDEGTPDWLVDQVSSQQRSLVTLAWGTGPGRLGCIDLLRGRLHLPYTLPWEEFPMDLIRLCAAEHRPSR